MSKIQEEYEKLLNDAQTILDEIEKTKNLDENIVKMIKTIWVMLVASKWEISEETTERHVSTIFIDNKATIVPSCYSYHNFIGRSKEIPKVPYSKEKIVKYEEMLKRL